MIFKVTLKNPKNEEYGEATVPFPTPAQKYETILEQLEGLELGNAVLQDCQISEIDSAYPILKRMEGSSVNGQGRGETDRVRSGQKAQCIFPRRNQVTTDGRAATCGSQRNG